MRIELQEVLKSYKSLRALDEISISIEPGQIVALLGQNGAGKTTLLRCLAGTVAADKGQVLYDGENFTRKRIDLRKRFSFLPDFPAVFEEWSPLRHIGMAIRLYGKNGDAELEERVVQLLEEFDLLPLANAPFFVLSRGQRYKAVLVALLAVNPELWLLDEPFASGMDPNGLNTFKRHAREAASKGQTIIYSTQILDAAERFSDRVCIIHRGKVRAFEQTKALREAEQSGGSALDELFRRMREEETQ